MDGRGRCCKNDDDNLKATELRLGLPGEDEAKEAEPALQRGKKRACEFSESCHETAPKAKAQAVGWPPIRSYRTKSFKVAKESEPGGVYVKVSMDGAPYLRKIDLKVYEGYKELRGALEGLFMCFSLGDGSEFAITYRDKDGDWMLVGDVPWEMFIASCKRLRIMKESEARGLSS